jgi:alpha-L-rhamnosidase
MRILVPSDPPYDRGRHYHEASPYRARWVAHPNAPAYAEAESPFFAVYRLRFRIEQLRVARINVSADERYLLSLDGLRLGRGPERGSLGRWCFETYDIPLSAGEHTLTVSVHSLCRHRAWGQLSVRHGLLVLAEGDAEELLSTGIAAWECAEVPGISAERPSLPRSFIATGGRLIVPGASLREPTEFVPVREIAQAVPASARMEAPGVWGLVPAVLPMMYEQDLQLGRVRHVDTASPVTAVETPAAPASHLPAAAEEFQRLLAGQAPVVIPPNSARRVIIDLEDYYCVYPRLMFSGGTGGTVRIDSAEALFEADGFTKHNRNDVAGLYFRGQGDQLHPDGRTGVTYEAPIYLAGRYLQLTVSTADEPLKLGGLTLTETHYPYTWDTQFQSSDARLARLRAIALRSLEMCSHDTYYDCPYYEQLMYVGDTRLEVLVGYTHCHDDRLPRKAITMFDDSRNPDGWTSARLPTRITQTIPPFSLWWVGMVWDFHMWRNDPGFVRARMPGVRAVLEAARECVGPDLLFHPPAGWNFVDWIAHLGGVERKPCAVLHWHMVYTLRLAADLEVAVGEPSLARRHRDLADRMTDAGNAAFWDDSVGLYRELPAGETSRHDRYRPYTEHAQCLALLAGAVPPARRSRLAAALFSREDLVRTTIYFSHYLFEACHALADLGGIDVLFRRLELWHNLDPRGFKTTFEAPEPTRSDCHAWGAHPLYHLYATVLGVRPAAPGFRRVRIEPRLGPLEWIKGTLHHPDGGIGIEVRGSGGRTEASVTLPPGIAGELVLDGSVTAIPARPPEP